MKITIDRLRSIIAEETAASKARKAAFLVTAADGGGMREWIVGAVEAPDAETAKDAGVAAYSERIGGNYVYAWPMPSGATVASVNEMVDALEEAEALQRKSYDLLRRARFGEGSPRAKKAPAGRKGR
jgi:hypothetical protein